MHEMNQKIEEEKQLVEDQIKKKQEEYEKQMKDLEYKMAQVEEEQRKQFELELQETEKLMIQKIENMERERIEREKQQQRELEEQEKMLKDRQKENESLEIKLSQLMPLINEANLQYQSKILRQKVKKIETKSQNNWDKKSKKLRQKVKKIETKSQKKLRQIFSIKNIKNYKLIWSSVSFIFNALCKSTWKWFNHIWYCFIINFIVCIFDFYNQFWFFINLFLHQFWLY